VERYDRDLKDIFAVQGEINRRIISTIDIKVPDNIKNRLNRVKLQTRSIDAYEKFLQGMRYYYQGDRNGNAQAREMFEQAIAQDSGFAQAYGALAWCHLIDAKEGWTGSRRESMRTAFKTAQKAVSLDESSVMGRRTLSRIFLRMGRYDSAVAEAEKAVALKPGNAEANATLGLVLTFAGRSKEAIPMLKRAILLNPIPAFQYYQMLGHAYIGTAAYDDAIAAYKRALQGLPDSIWGRLGLIAAYALAGQIDDARSNAAQLLRSRPGFSLDYVTNKMPYKNPADLTKFIDALRKAGMK
jgi:adenylate cyclase